MTGILEPAFLSDAEVKKLAKIGRMPKFMYDTADGLMSLRIFAQNVRRQDAADRLAAAESEEKKA